MSARVLVVEDDKDIRRNVVQLLELEGYAVEAAGNGLEALTALQGAQVLPSVIILDLMMPVMDGFQFREEKNKQPQLAKIPVIIMTADGRTDEKRMRAGAVAALRKPADVDAILNLVSKFCAKP